MPNQLTRIATVARWAIAALIVACALPVDNLLAQGPRRASAAVRPIATVQRDSGVARRAPPDSTSVARSELQAQDPGTRAGINVGWTLLGAVGGYLWYQSHQPKGDGDMGAPFTILFTVGAGALLGTLVGAILR